MAPHPTSLRIFKTDFGTHGLPRPAREAGAQRRVSDRSAGAAVGRQASNPDAWRWKIAACAKLNPCPITLGASGSPHSLSSALPGCQRSRPGLRHSRMNTSLPKSRDCHIVEKDQSLFSGYQVRP
jgi:hypothetical protein